MIVALTFTAFFGCVFFFFSLISAMCVNESALLLCRVLCLFPAELDTRD